MPSAPPFATRRQEVDGVGAHPSGRGWKCRKMTRRGNYPAAAVPQTRQQFRREARREGPRGESVQRVPPAQTWKPCKVPVSCDLVAAGFDGQGGEVGVRHQVALGARATAQRGEQAPMTRAGVDGDAVRPLPEPLHE